MWLQRLCLACESWKQSFEKVDVAIIHNAQSLIHKHSILFLDLLRIYKRGRSDKTGVLPIQRNNIKKLENPIKAVFTCLK